MFSYLTRFLYRFHDKPVRTALIAALAVLIVSVLLASFVRWLRRRRQDSPENWTGLITGSVGAVVKVLIGLVILAGLCLHLSFQSAEFARLRGGVTQRSYEAVKTIWGRPHAQRELTVRLTYHTMHYYDKDGMELDAKKLKATTQPIGFRKEKREHTVPGNPVVKADHDIAVWMNYRKKGGAWYPCFETDFLLKYRVVNFSGRDVKAVFNFPLPARQGLIDRLTVTVDGKKPKAQVVATGAKLTWGLPMAAGQEHELLISYHSRGMSYLRFEPGAGKQLQNFRVTMTCRDIKASEINYPIGCMTPTNRRETSGDTILSWNLDNAVTRFGMGVIVPKKQQEGYYVARVLAAGPWGFILLLGMVAVTYLATGRPINWIPMLLLAIAYHLFYLLTAHISDYWPGLYGGMIISGTALTALMALLHFKLTDRFAAWATLILFIVFVAAYPLLRINDYEGLLLSILYVALLAYVVALVISRRKQPAG